MTEDEGIELKAEVIRLHERLRHDREMHKVQVEQVSTQRDKMVVEVQRMKDIVNAKYSVEEQGEAVKDTLIKQLTVKLQEQTKKARDLQGRIKIIEESRG